MSTQKHQTNPFSRRQQLLTLALSTTMVGLAHADNLTWDNAATAGIQGGTGTWDTTTNTNWSALGDGTDRATWNNVSNSDDIALFTTGTGTVTIGETINLAGLTISSTNTSTIGGIGTMGYRFTGSTLNFGSQLGSINTTASGLVNHQIDSNLTGTNGLTVASTGTETGQGRLVLNGDNTGLTGGITITSGLISFTSQNAAGNNLITLNGGGIFGATGYSGTGSTAISPTEQTLSNNISLSNNNGNALRVWGGRTLTLTGNISGTGGFTKTDSGTLILTGTNTYQGKTIVSAGALSTATIGNTTAIAVGNAGNSTTWIYTGTGETTASVLEFAGTTGGATITNNGTGLLRFTSNTVTSGVGDKGITFNGTGNGQIDGTISANATLMNLTKSGTGTWSMNGNLTLGTGGITISGGQLNLNGTNSYSGTTNINNVAAILGIGSNNATGTGTLRFGEGTIQSTDSTARSIGNAIDFASNITMGGTGDLTFTGAVALGNAANGIKTATVNNGRTTFSGVLSSTDTAGQLVKEGAGTLILTANNTYQKRTTINAGKLLINGSHSGAGVVTVNAGGTLGGTGSVASAVNVTGILAPGASIESFATGTLTFNTGSTFSYEINSSVSPATSGDLQIVNGNLLLNGLVNLTLTDLATNDTAFANGTVLSLINYSGTWNNGVFTFGGNDLANGEEFSDGLNTWRIDYNSATGGSNFSGEYITGSFVNLTAVPEPSIAFLGMLGALSLLRRRR